MLQNAAGPRIEPPVSEPSAPPTSPVASATAEPLEVPRILRGLEAMARELDAERELVRDELAEHHRASLPEPRHAGRVVLGNPVGEEGGAGGGADAARGVDVLVGDGNAEEGARVLADRKSVV